MHRRHFVTVTALVGLFASHRAAATAAGKPAAATTPPPAAPGGATLQRIDKLTLSAAEWKQRLTPEQYRILREEGTERPGSSPLDREKRKGVYACAGCGLELFTSEAKYDSGTGWPSFWAAIPDRLGTRTDFKLIYPRTEYHCIRCGGHQGHVFNDGPPPTGKRYCNNGVALTFTPAP